MKFIYIFHLIFMIHYVVSRNCSENTIFLPNGAKIFKVMVDPYPLISVSNDADKVLYEALVKKDGMKHSIFYVLRESLLEFKNSRRHHSQSDYIIDWGCNFGTVSIIAAKLGFHSLCVEASPHTQISLAINLALNCVQDMVQLIKSGVSNKQGQLYMANNSLSGSNGLDFSNTTKADHVLVPVNTWDNIVHDLNFTQTAALMKIDIEGGEYNALLGAKEFFKHRPPKMIIIEYRPHRTHVLKLLNEEYFYHLYVLDNVDDCGPDQGLQWKTRPIYDLVEFDKGLPNVDVVGVLDKVKYLQKYNKPLP